MPSTCMKPNVCFNVCVCVYSWHAIIVDGHSVEELCKALSQPRHQPTAIIAKTIKGKGIPGNFLLLSLSTIHQTVFKSPKVMPRLCAFSRRGQAGVARQTSAQRHGRDGYEGPAEPHHEQQQTPVPSCSHRGLPTGEPKEHQDAECTQLQGWRKGLPPVHKHRLHPHPCPLPLQYVHTMSSETTKAYY